MFGILLLAGFIVGLGLVMRASRAAILALLGLLVLAVLTIHLTLPEGHALRAATGGSLQAWAWLAAIAGLVGLYALGVRWLRQRARPLATGAPSAPLLQANPLEQEADMTGPFNERELERYARHIVLREIGGQGQKRLKDARVLVIGAGGLGSPAILYLAAAGIGTIGIVDDDEVSLSNLQRQVLHDEGGIGTPKVDSARARISTLNPHVEVRALNTRLTGENAAELFSGYDLVLDGSDNFSTRYLVNRVACAQGIPLIAAAISQWEGQISLYDPAHGTPCYACVFPEAPAPGLAPSCAEAGVVGALPGVVGAMMAIEAIKFVTGAGKGLAGEMLIYDALYGESRKVRLARRDDCAVCGKA